MIWRHHLRFNGGYPTIPRLAYVLLQCLEKEQFSQGTQVFWVFQPTSTIETLISWKQAGNANTVIRSNKYRKAKSCIIYTCAKIHQKVTTE